MTAIVLLRLWADLRSVAPPDMAVSLRKCERAADSPVDSVLVTGVPLLPFDDCEVIVCAPSALLMPSGQHVGVRVDASSPAGQAAAFSAVGSADWIHLDASTQTDWTMIPAENIISACDGTPTQVAVSALTAEQVPGLAFALELGVDALVLLPPGGESGEALWEAAAIARAQRAERDESVRTAGREHTDDAPVLTTGVVTSINPGGVGDRVALDFTSLLRMGEGALVGSSAKLLSLVHGETIQGTLVPARPFRVNAGPVHSYILLAGSSAISARVKYLEEVRPGDNVQIVDAHGNARSLTVGRCKIEPRPLLQISFEADGASGQVFLQQAETVRMLVESGDELQARSVTEIQVGDRLRVRRTVKGTHVGRAISARVEER
uniref:3-dehydroquinate synthase n=1 Tax=Coccolithus braarudii TaxID=221442 RepID=A0A7S0KZ43_9EUKA|mmetsp:Transcript_10167/g.22034  ORF Transcript_10167/g.22034 Transcript_10167/m.22034 type:complete len:379 (+) Transcript_10167:11-1147(+)